MKINTGIITEKLSQSKKFYSDCLGFGITFENEFYILMHSSNRQAELAFLLPNHPTQQPFFHAPFNGSGIFITIEVDDVDIVYEEIKKKGIDIKIELRDEPWGDRHFSIEDPNGVGIDIVKYTAPSQ